MIPLLFCWNFSCFCQSALLNCFCSWYSWPLYNICPVAIHSQKSLQATKRAVVYFTYILAGFYSSLANTSAVPRQRLSDHKTRFRSEMPTFLLQAHTHLPKLSGLTAQSPSVLAHSCCAFLCCRLQHCIQVPPHVSECLLSFPLGYYPNPASADLFLPRMLLSGYPRQMYLRQIHQHPSARPALPWHSLNTLPVSLYSGLVFLKFFGELSPCNFRSRPVFGFSGPCCTDQHLSVNFPNF